MAFEYGFNENKNQLIFQFNSNFPHKGKLRILNPWLDLDHRKEELREKLEVQIDGKDTAFDIETRYSDLYIVITTDFDNHIARISIK